MQAHIVRIGNSRGVRLPKEMLDHYRLGEGAPLILEERQEGILIRPAPAEDGKVGWAQAYEELAAERAGDDEWADWDALAGDNLDD